MAALRQSSVPTDRFVPRTSALGARGLTRSFGQRPRGGRRAQLVDVVPGALGIGCVFVSPPTCLSNVLRLERVSLWGVAFWGVALKSFRLKLTSRSKLSAVGVNAPPGREGCDYGLALIYIVKLLCFASVCRAPCPNRADQVVPSLVADAPQTVTNCDGASGFFLWLSRSTWGLGGIPWWNVRRATMQAICRGHLRSCVWIWSPGCEPEALWFRQVPFTLHRTHSLPGVAEPLSQRCVRERDLFRSCCSGPRTNPRRSRQARCAGQARAYCRPIRQAHCGCYGRYRHARGIPFALHGHHGFFGFLRHSGVWFPPKPSSIYCAT